MLSDITFLPYTFSVSFFFSISGGVTLVLRKRICRGSVASLESWIIQEGQVAASYTLATALSWLHSVTVSHLMTACMSCPGYTNTDSRILQSVLKQKRACRITFHVQRIWQLCQWSTSCRIYDGVLLPGRGCSNTMSLQVPRSIQRSMR
jgi:hypothetical protein